MLPEQLRHKCLQGVPVLGGSRVWHAGAREAVKQGIERIGFVAEVWID